MATAKSSVYVNNIVDEETTHSDVVYMECVGAEDQYAAYEEMPSDAEETTHIDVVYTECFDAEHQSAHIEMFPDVEETTHIEVVYTECFDDEGQSAYEEMSPGATTNPAYTDLNIANTRRDNQSIQTNNSRSRTIHVQYRLLILISCFLIMLVVTNVVTFITTKDKISPIKKNWPCFSNPCFNSGSCTVLGKNYTCNCQNGTDGKRCQDVFYETITSPGYPSNYTNKINNKWTIDVGLGNKVRLTFSLFELEKDYDYVKIYDGHSTKCDLIGIFTGNTLPKDWTSTERNVTILFTSDGSKTGRGFRVDVYKRQSI